MSTHVSHWPSLWTKRCAATDTLFGDFIINFVRSLIYMARLWARILRASEAIWAAILAQIWSRQSIAKTPVFAIEILNTENDVIWHQKILMLNFYSTYKFFLTSYVTDMNYITHRRFFVILYQPIHWYLTRILTFLSEQRAPFSTMFTSRPVYNVVRSYIQHSMLKHMCFSIEWIPMPSTKHLSAKNLPLL